VSDFQELYQRYNKDIYYFILKMTYYNSDLAEELTQETFYQLYISLARFKGKCDIKTWICTIAKNVCFKYYRKNPVVVSMDQVYYHNSIEMDFEKMIDNKEAATQIIAEILKLREKYREVLIYRLYFELSFKSIGEILKINQNSAKVIYYRGKEMVKSRLGEFV
jgi:RNA polymerase sigma-70 factor (ECF subfamily)